jgi:hypothetical protein
MATRLPSLWVLALWLLVAPACAEPVPTSAKDVVPAAVGDRAPSAPVRDLDGRSVELSHLLADRGVMLVFYRGGW